MTIHWLLIAIIIGAFFVYINVKKAKKDIANYKKYDQNTQHEDIH